MASADLALLGTFQKHIEDMRALIHCKICLKPFYEPFALGCGHTYCYSCLSGWLNGPHNRREQKGCPDCRKPIISEPAPNYALKDMAHMFLNRIELLPEDETLQEHEEGIREEKKAIDADKKGPGLFKGRFRHRRFIPPGLPRPIRDAGDGVDRCPSCMWELEEGECGSCGWPHFDDDDDDSSSDDEVLNPVHIPIDHMIANGYISDDDDRDLSPAEEMPRPVRFRDLRRRALDYRAPAPVSESGSLDFPVSIGDTDDDDESHDDEHDSAMDDFIDDDDMPDEIDHDDMRSVNDYPVFAAPHNNEFLLGLENSENEDDETDVDAPRPPARYRNMMRSPPIAIDDDDDEDDNERMANEPDAEERDQSGSESGSDTTNTHNTGYDTGSEATISNARDVAEDVNFASDSDSDDVRIISPPIRTAAIATRPNKRRIVQESEDESEASAEESDDTAIQAPQTAAARNRRLHARRATTRLQTARRSPQPSPPRPSSASGWARRANGGNGYIHRGGPAGSARGDRRWPYPTRVH